MRGLYISFVIKRRKKIDKIMDYFLVLAIFIFLFVFLFYVQYVQKENKYNSTNQKLQKSLVELETVKAKYEKNNKENASAIEKEYNTAYDELETMTLISKKYSGYIQDIYKAVIPGVTINGFSIDMNKKVILLTLQFDKTVDTQVDYRYKSDLLDYSWVPKNGIEYDNESITTVWEVHVNDGSTTKE